jgi:licheninase
MNVFSSKILKFLLPMSDNHRDRRKGKPVARRGRKATGLSEVAGLPKGEAMRRIILVLVAGVLQAALIAGAAQAGTLDFFDDFDAFDTTRWTEADHNLGRSYLDPNDVSVDNGNLAIKLPARTADGGEVMSNDLYGSGSYSARMKLPNAPSSITGFFLYKPPDYQSEIDVELYNDSSRRIMFTTYANGARTQTMQLPFDPTADYHEYRFDYASDSLSFYVDGQPMKTWTDGLPQNSMRIYVNAWFPTWLKGTKPRTDRFLYVDSIGYTQQ